jgi:hypothetical protein
LYTADDISFHTYDCDYLIIPAAGRYLESYDSLNTWNVNAVSKGVILMVPCDVDRSISSYLGSTDNTEDSANNLNPLHKSFLHGIGGREGKGQKWRGRDQFLQLKIGEIRCESGDALQQQDNAGVKIPADTPHLSSQLLGVEWGYDTDRPRERPPDVIHVGRGYGSSTATLLLDTGQVY